MAIRPLKRPRDPSHLALSIGYREIQRQAEASKLIITSY
jgi:hypothetical protein